MSNNTVVRARIDEQVKRRPPPCWRPLASVSDAFRLMMMRIAKDKALPVSPWCRYRNDRAIKDARRRDLVTVGAPDKLLASLDAGD